MKCQLTTPIDVLNGDEAWDLFRMKAEFDESVSRDVVEEAKKVAGECKGVPVAIVTVASALKGTRSRKGWELARRELESNRLPEIGNIEEKEIENAYRCIQMSFDYLKKETTKRCFLMCALYPEDHSIDVEDLVRYAWGLKLYGKSKSVEDVRFQVSEAINYLIKSCLLLEDGDVGRHVKLHDIVRDVALWTASKEESGFTIQSRSNRSFKPCTAISLSNIEERIFPEKLEHSKLELLMLNNCNVQGTCFQGMKELKVLSLTIPRNPQKLISVYALTSLVKLRTLHLENFDDFSFLGNLGALEILTLRESRLEGLAEELVRLENLKILDVTGCTLSLRWPPNVIRRMFKLEELYLKDTHIQRSFDDTLPEINSLSRLTALSLHVSSFHFMKGFEFPKLERYRISVGSRDTVLTEKSWEIREKIPLNVISVIPESLESLKVLENADEFMDCITNKGLMLSNLKLLHVGNLSGISEFLTHVRVEGLVDLRIRNCPSLKLLFPLSLTRSLVLLETLEISGCHGLKQIVTELEGDGEDEEMPSTINSHHSFCFPKLRKVHIEKCNDLEYIFPALMALQGHHGQGLSVSISDCPQLKQVIQVENDVMLQQLQFLGSLSSISVRSCPLLSARLEALEAHLEEVRLSACKGSFNSSKHLQLTRAIKDHTVVPNANEDGLNGLTSLQVESCQDLECLVDTTMGNGPTSALTRLEKLKITNSQGLETICKGQPPHGFLKTLKELAVRDCSKLQVVLQIEDIPCKGEQNQEKTLSNLQSLELFDLPELRWVFKGSAAHSFSLQSLKVVNIENCRKLESIFSPSLVQSLVMLENLKIQNCQELKALLPEPENVGEIESNNSSLPLCLPKLKILDIDWCTKLEYVVPITLAQGLPALESLSVSYCGELKQVFGMEKEEDRVEHPGVLCFASLQDVKLKQLKNLTGFVPENYIVKPPALKSIRACGCPKVINFPIQQASKQLSLETDGLSIFKKLLYNTDSLHLLNVEDHKILVPHADLGHLDRLTSLHIDDFSGGECLVDTSEGMKGQPFLQNLRTLSLSNCYDMLEVFRIDVGLYNREENQPAPPPMLSNLEHLNFWYLSKLKCIVQGPTHCVNLQSLKVLDISGCYELRSLFSVSVVQTLGSLEQLRIFRCTELKSVFMELECDDDDGSEPDRLCLPNLKTMDIADCLSLEYVFPHALAPAFPRLQKLKLDRLRCLRSVVAGHHCLEAPALEILFVRDCSLLTNITLLKGDKCVPLKELTYSGGGGAESKNMENSQLCQKSPNFESITIGNFEQLLQLQGGYLISGPEKMELKDLIWLRNIWKGPLHVAINLRELNVYDCNSLTYIFPVMLIPHLPHLSRLRILWCENLKQIIGNDDDILASSSSQGPPLEKKMVFPQLKAIEISGSPRLESFTPVGYHLELPCLEQFNLKGCYKMMTSFTVDYLTLTVHAKTNQVDDAGPSQNYIFWVRCRPTSLPQYAEEAEEISPLM